jgi:hypothetical protein
MPENEMNTPDDLRDVFDVSDANEREATTEVEQEQPSEAGMLKAPDTGVAYGNSRSLSVGTPSRPLFGRLPLARIVPQDVHSVMDYLDGGGVLAAAFTTSCRTAKAASWVMGGAGILASSLTDYRLSLAKIVPIEAHEVVDYAFGISAITAPFIFGYRKTAPLVAATHVAIGIGAILASLFTDYRAYRGVGRRAAA